MTQQDPPWFPGQFGRPDGAPQDFTGDPYTDEPTDTEPYAPATLNDGGTNPYGDLPAPPAALAGTPSLPDGGASPGSAGPAGGPGAGGLGPVRIPGTARMPGTGGSGTATPTSSPAGYEDFYEPGSLDRADLRPPRGRKRRSFAGRRGEPSAARGHGPRPARRDRNRGPGPGAPGAEASGAAAPSDSSPGAGTGTGTPTIVVVPGEAAATGRGASAASDETGAGPGTGKARGTSTGADRGTGVGTDGLTGLTGRDGNADNQGGRWRRNLLVLVLAGVVVSGVVGVVSGLGDEPDPRPTTAPTTSPSPPRTTPGPTPDPLPSPTAATPPEGEVAVGATVSDGPFDVEVVGVSTGLTELAGSTATTTAEGEYVVVRLRVTATAPEPSYFLDIDQRLVDAGGAEHQPDPGAAMAVDGNRLWLAELGQGESAEGVVVFDVPAGTQPATFVLHASDESAGVPVELPTS